MLKPLAWLVAGAALLTPAQDEVLGVKEWWGSFTATLKGEFSHGTSVKGLESITDTTKITVIDRYFSGSFHLNRGGRDILLPGLMEMGGHARHWGGRRVTEPVAHVKDAMSEKTVQSGTGRNWTASNSTVLSGKVGPEFSMDNPVLAIDTRKKLYHLHFQALPLVLLQALGVEVSGTLQQTDRDGKTKTEVIESVGVPGTSVDLAGEGYPDFLLGKFYNRALPGNAATITDTISIGLKSEGLQGSARLVLTWTFTQKPPEKLELVLEKPAGYDAWRPKAGTDETKPGESITVRAKLREKGAKGDAPPAVRATSITFHLRNVSREPGTCINWPASPAKPAPPDMKFEAERNPGSTVLNDGLGLEKKEDKMWKAAAELTTFDWGAYADLQAVAVLETGAELVSIVDGEPGLISLPLPKSAPGCRVADVWKQSTGASGPDVADDEDDPVGDGNKGDGLTLYQEYRGYHAKGKHAEGDPRKKDFFIVDAIGNGSTKAGIRLFKDLSGLRVEDRLMEDEIGPNRAINFNRGGGGQDQHAVIVKLHANYGACEAYGGPATPKGIQYVGIVPLGSLVMAPPEGGANPWKGFRDEEWLIRGMAHELLHCCNVYHHGDDVDYRMVVGYVANAAGVVELRGMGENPSTRKMEAAGPPLRLFDEPNVPAEYPGKPALFQLMVGVPHGTNSGFENCIMRYDNVDLYPKGPAFPNDYVRVETDDRMGDGLCSSTAGVDFNRVPRTPGGGPPFSRFQGADVSKQRGKCKLQICVNDAAKPANRGSKPEGK